MITIIRAVQTCGACPSQWDAWDAKGQEYYLRYRFGHGTLQRGSASGPLLGEFDTGDPWDGVIGLDEFIKNLRQENCPVELSGMPA